jgi:hypothetical protein
LIDVALAGHGLAEITVRLDKLGSEGTAPHLASLLLNLLGPGGAAAVPAGDPAAAAQLLATAAANMARVQYGPLPEACDPQPLDALFRRLKARFLSCGLTNYDDNVSCLHSVHDMDSSYFCCGCAD